MALANTAFGLVDEGFYDDGLNTCARAEVILRTLPDTERVRLVSWMTRWVRAIALVAQGKHRAGVDAFSSMYTTLMPENHVAVQVMTRLAGSLVAVGASALDLATILTNDRAKAGLFVPVIVALQQHAGEEVRAPTEIREVAAHILEQFKAEAARISEQRLAKDGPSSDHE